MSGLQKYRREELIYLLSNGSQEVHPDNSPSSFRVELSTPLDFGAEVDQWEVGVIELQIPSTFFNVTNGNNSFRVSMPSGAAFDYQEAKRQRLESKMQRKEEASRRQREKKLLEASRTRRQAPAREGRWEEAVAFTIEAPYTFGFANVQAFAEHVTGLVGSEHFKLKYNAERNTLVLHDKQYTKLRLTNSAVLNRLGVRERYQEAWLQLYSTTGTWTIASVVQQPDEPVMIEQPFIIERKEYLPPPSPAEEGENLPVVKEGQAAVATEETTREDEAEEATTTEEDGEDELSFRLVPGKLYRHPQMERLMKGDTFISTKAFFDALNEKYGERRQLPRFNYDDEREELTVLTHPMNIVRFPENHRPMLEEMGMEPEFIGRDLTITQGEQLLFFEPKRPGPFELKKHFGMFHSHFDWEAFRLAAKPPPPPPAPTEEEEESSAGGVPMQVVGGEEGGETAQASATKDPAGGGAVEDNKEEMQMLDDETGEAAPFFLPPRRFPERQLLGGGGRQRGGPSAPQEAADRGTFFGATFAPGERNEWVERLRIPNGHYRTAKDIVAAMEQLINGYEHLRNKFRFTILPNGTLRIRCLDEEYWIMLDQGLERTMGLNKRYHGQWIRPAGTEYTGVPVELNGGQSYFLLYSDVGEMVRVGSHSSRILRCISSTGAGGAVGSGEPDTVAMYFPNVYYVPLAKSRIDSISMALYNDFGQLVRFTKGKTLAVLHFRRRALL